MSDTRRIPADMLLIAERRRRMGAAAPAPIEEPPVADVAPQPSAGPDDFFEDALIAETPAQQSELQPALTLFRPLAQVSLAAQHWSSSVDHEALQSAIVCCPVSAAATSPFEQSLIAVVPMALAAQPGGVATLHVTLSADDIAAVEHGMRRASRASGLRLVRAAALPTGIAGAEPASAGLAAPALAAYRHAALIHAWNAVLGAPAAVDLERDRDAAAVNLLSTLRGLLGET
ncbi:MAG: hypothetical protein JO194_04820 [Candidatus Eremiobacteraeota bacterium]|nr:hypothetical protein [Candidatus Eremiobacteraeota bacterium]